ncbi:MAG: hypothetical protein ACK5IQ_08195 [Bacteroidales bacterium]
MKNANHPACGTSPPRGEDLETLLLVEEEYPKEEEVAVLAYSSQPIA